MLLTGKRFLTARAALIYLTLGALTEVWSGVWFWYLSGRNPPPTDLTWLFCYGLVLTGLALLVIGFLIYRVSGVAPKSPPVAMPAEPAIPSNVALDVSPRGIANPDAPQKEASYGSR